MLTPRDQPIDSLADLTPDEWEALSEWEGLFSSKYDCVGELVEPEEYERRGDGTAPLITASDEEEGGDDEDDDDDDKEDDANGSSVITYTRDIDA
ncbi:hypothetical protein SYNPS1DRAFT_23145 [Syncephalis pseudoplumigaleata]|uniref:Uncharacterized protein n=1 Tax=Syncephalis pseudoplumigaleata TaxID=1712513 RepID=A0A4P9Z0D4_9FUNG|nr:hypothetical protein SYNPS1DRAFT_23145 [Syncephalis pseudoplumigaleata]|eukprot:RKP24800.1 hypothetical protein SYNPS1DRAFT_23145 [Syncephalis pseudoplumigaleata]